MTTCLTRTPPDIKWLLNERAALAGEVEKAGVTRERLQLKVCKLEQQLKALQRQIDRSQVARSRAQASLDSLDATMALVHAQLNPAAAGEVHAWAGKYGVRGGLGAFIGKVLKGAAPEPVTTAVLIDLASRHFGVDFPLPKDRRNFRKSVSSALTSLHKRRLIEPLHDRTEGSHGCWRWGTAMPTFEEMAEHSKMTMTSQVVEAK